MPKLSPPYLGEFEHLVLLAILQLGPEAYGVGIGRELEANAGRRVARGALYTTLDRLEDKGLVRWKFEPGGDERGRVPRRIYTLTALGLAAIRASHQALAKMTRGLDALLRKGRAE
jgi:PadR family transcriptional regulator PadR